MGSSPGRWVERQKENGIDVCKIREKKEWRKRGVNIEDNIRLMRFREDYKVKRAKWGRKEGGGLKGANVVQDVRRGWNTISARERLKWM